MSQYLILLAIIPLSCLQLTKLFKTQDRWLVCGLSLGMVIAPVSFGLIQYTYIPIIGKLLGFIGLLFNLTHGSVGYFCLAGSGLLDSGALLSTSQFVLINLVNAVIFACAYGMIGHAIDRKLAAERKVTAAEKMENISVSM
ncbi:MAG TPA: hypothetical protein DDW42_03155 [Desulfobacteraceae bacterium]|nr:hypothetical protein [Desulfobacteraceae bacterium]